MADENSTVPERIGLVRCRATGRFALWNSIDDSPEAVAAEYIRSDLAAAPETARQRDRMLEALISAKDAMTWSRWADGGYSSVYQQAVFRKVNAAIAECEGGGQ